jgi:hypothetical protein
MYRDVWGNATTALACSVGVLTSATLVCFIIKHGSTIGCVLGSGSHRHQVGYITSHVTLLDRTRVFGWGLGGCGASGRIRKMGPVGPGFQQATETAIGLSTWAWCKFRGGVSDQLPVSRSRAVEFQG